MQTTPPSLRLCLQLALVVASGLHSARAQGPNFDPNQPPQPEPVYTTSHLDGVVVSSLDGRPVSRVLVTSTDRRMAVLTDDEGRFSFDLRRIVSQTTPQEFSSFPPTPATAAATIPVQFNLRKPGYIGNSVVAHVAAAPPSTPEPTLQLKIVPAAVLTGHLSPESGDLPAGADVMLQSKVIFGGAAAWPYRTAQVNSHGDFRFANLAPGDFRLVAPAYVPRNPPGPLPASMPGFRPSFYPNATSFDSAGIIHIGPGESSYASLTYRNADLYNVTIPVAALQDDKGFYVSLLPDMPGLAMVRTGDVAQGYLPSGSYEVQLRSAEVITSQNQFPITSVASVHLQIDGRPVRTNPVALHPEAEIPVEVHTDFSNTPLPQVDPQHPSPLVFVNLSPIDNVGPQPIAWNQPNGVTTIRNLYEGTFRVEISSAIAGYVAIATSGTTDLLREPLRVIAGSEPRPFEVTLRDDAASINARLAPAADFLPQATSDQPVYIICVPLDRPQAQAFNFTITRDDFGIPNLAPGRYLILATHQQLNQPARSGLAIEYRNEEAIPALIPKGVTVTLSPNQKADIEVPVMPEDAK